MSSENRTSVPNSLNEHWMPFTSNKDFKENPRLITEAKGVYLKTHHGKTQIDASSGLFCNPLGHGRREITEAVTKQLETLDYAQPFQQGFGGSFELATKIAKHTPGDLNKIFYTICGSTAVETALKIAIAYHRSKGHAERFRFVGRERGYHGMNIGCISVGGMVNNVKTFASVLMPGVQHISHTHLPEHKFISGQPETGDYLANDLETICQNFGGENIAACIVEPIAGSTGTLVPPKGYLQKLREICDKHGILLIFDEVITGWGRTGSKFGADEFGVTPDIMTMAKALTNASQPMGAVAVRDDIYSTIIDAAPENVIDFFHGYTYSAHPAACAAGIATQKIYEEEGTFEQAANLIDYFHDGLFTLQNLNCVRDIRCFGLMGGVELKSKGAPGALGTQMQKDLFWNGMHAKFTGDVAIMAPPFISEKEHIDSMIDILRQTIEKIE